MKAHLTQLLAQAAKTVAPELAGIDIQLERPKSESHGDFSTNLAMLLAKQLGKNPKIIAEDLIKALPTSPDVSKVEIAGVGFINFFLAISTKARIVPQILQAGENFGFSNAGEGRKVMVEFVSANPTGPLHVGHGRGAAVGDCLCRLLAATGWKVTSEFYYNDAGAQIDSLVSSVKCRCKGIMPDDPSWPEDGYRGEYIIEIAQAYLSKQTILTKEYQVKALGDADNTAAIREFAIAYLRHEQDQDLRAFGVSFDVYSLESALYTDGKVEETVKLLVESGHTYEQDKALWLRTTDFGDDKDRVMRKADGSYTYFVPDVAYHVDKWNRGFERVINEQGADHHSTIIRVRAGLQALNIGIPQGWPDYVIHQMVTVMSKGEEMKISKRTGSYVTLRDLIDEVGCDATRYFLAVRRPDSQLVFDIDLAREQTSDNPVYYIQYAHARICGVLNQWGGDIVKLANVDLAVLVTEYELSLLQRLAAFPEVIAAAAVELAPYALANYLKDLAADLHSYYNAQQFLVKDETVKLARLSLIAATRYVLNSGLKLLGINAPEKM